MVRQAPTEQTVPADQRPTITTILWTIYLNPADAPGQAVLRPHACLRDGRVLAGTRSWIRPTVADCRALIPKSAKRLNVADPDKTIQEVWMQNIGSGASAGDQTGRGSSSMAKAATSSAASVRGAASPTPSPRAMAAAKAVRFPSRVRSS